MNRKLFARYVLGQVVGILGMIVTLFLSSGKLDWWGAWGAVAVMTSWMIAMVVVIVRIHPALLEERLGARKQSKPWDTVILSLINLTTFIRYIIAGLDRRNGWSGGFPAGAQLAALVICFLGYALFTWAIASNKFFTQVVRIQPERGHTVVTGGPYRYVRHPAYIGVIFYELAVCVLLGSWWAFIASGVSVTLIVIRTAFEDRTLQVELAGYADYAQRVRYRLLPGIW